MIFALITAWLAYKKAKDAGRNGILWAALGAIVFIGTQVIVSIGFGFLLAIGVEFRGWSETI
jgi:hypothetical protein